MFFKGAALVAMGNSAVCVNREDKDDDVVVSKDDVVRAYLNEAAVGLDEVTFRKEPSGEWKLAPASPGQEKIDKSDRQTPTPRANAASPPTLASSVSYRAHDQASFHEWIGLPLMLQTVWPHLGGWLEESILKQSIEPMLSEMVPIDTLLTTEGSRVLLVA